MDFYDPWSSFNELARDECVRDPLRHIHEIRVKSVSSVDWLSHLQYMAIGNRAIPGNILGDEFGSSKPNVPSWQCGKGEENRPQPH